MLKKGIVSISSALALVFGACTFASATMECPSVEVVSTGTTAYTASGLFVKVKNVSGGPCGSLGNNQERQYFLDTTNADRAYATILTAASLDRQMYIQTAGTGAKNSLLTVVSMKPAN